MKPNRPTYTTTAQFDYEISPGAVPTTGDASLMIAVHNGTQVNVDVARLVFVVPVGSDNSDLTADSGSIRSSATTGTTWSIQGDGTGTFTCTPTPPATGLQAGESIAFSLADISVNDVCGLAEIEVYEDTSVVTQTALKVSKIPEGLAITRFAASPIQILPGEPVTLSWNSTGAASAILSFSGGSQPVAVSGSQTLEPIHSTVYTLTVSGGGSTIAQQITVFVVRTHILSFAADPVQIAKGTSSQLSWQIVNATTAYIEPGYASISPTTGTYSVTPTETVRYLLVANGPAGTKSMEAVVEVMQVSLRNFTGPTAIVSGKSATLQWETLWASSVSIDNGVGAVQSSGSQLVAPTKDTTYTLTAQGFRGPIQQQVTILVREPVRILSFSTKYTKGTNGWVVLRWTTENCTSASIDNGIGPVEPNGTRDVQLETEITYTLTCLGADGPKTASEKARPW